MPKGQRVERSTADAVGCAVAPAINVTDAIEDTRLKQSTGSRSGLACAMKRIAAPAPKRRSEVARNVIGIQPTAIQGCRA